MAILLTGLNIPNSATVPGGLQFTRTGLDPGRHAPRQHRHQAERGGCLRLRCRPVAARPSRLGAIDGDLCGFPNGRRLLDDVTDIELRALVEGYGPTLNAVLGVPNRTPNNLLGDGVDANDTPVPVGLPVHRDAAPGLRRTSTSTATSSSRSVATSTARALARAVRIPEVRPCGRAIRGARRKRNSTFGASTAGTIGYGGPAAGLPAGRAPGPAEAQRKGTRCLAI